MKVDGSTLIGWGFKPGKWFKDAIATADAMARDTHFGKANHTEADMIAAVKKLEPTPIQIMAPQLPQNVQMHYNIDAENEYDEANIAKVKEAVTEIARIPVVRSISVMPDACPTGPFSVPVGTVVVAENAIVPGWHSADICCSVAMTVFPSDTNPTAVLDAGMKITHFGKGGRTFSHDMQVSDDLLQAFESNSYLTNKQDMVRKHFGTQGDGNHFFYVGRIESTGQIALVTHHGSRGPGARLYNAGVDKAQYMVGEQVAWANKANMWIPYDTVEGQAYWEALQIVRWWTKKNHYTIHDSIAHQLNLKVKDRFWNEHNFVFRREYGGKTYFVHAKGATPSYMGFAPDSMGRILIPLNMAAPIVVGKVNDNVDHGMDGHHSLGFAPHGAGRNYSRTEFGRLITGKAKEMIADVTSKIDVRAFSGKHDISEFPAAYKNAEQIQNQIKKYGLTDVVDLIQPLGCIMAGHDSTDYRAIKKAKKEAKKALDLANEENE